MKEMKKILPFILIAVLVVTSCKKEKPAPPTARQMAIDNSIRVGPTRTYRTITAGINAAVADQLVIVDAGTYRETPVGKPGVTVQPAVAGTVLCSCLEPITSPWIAHDVTGGKSIYKTTITLPVDNNEGFNLTISNSNTKLFNNQIFKDGAMQFEGRYPNIETEADLMLFVKQRHYSQTVNKMASTTQIVDNGIPVSGVTGAKLVLAGWFRTFTRVVSSQPSQNTLNYSPPVNNDGGLNKYRHWYYITGKLPLLDVAKEWHYDNATNTLYLWQTGGGSPTGIEYKARNWGFDVRDVDDFTIKGINFIGCEIARGNTATDRNLVEGVTATHTNHDVMYEDIFPGYGNATETGTQLLGVDNVFKNNETQWTASHGTWLGTRGLFENNWIRDTDYDGSWGAPVSFAGDYPGNSGMAMWGDAHSVKILRNKFERMGRSAVDMSFSYTSKGVHQNHNIEVGYNEMTMWGMLNVDVGAIYSWGFRDLTGSVYHHNYFHHDGVVADPTGAALHGGQYGSYQDQASGPVTHHHNIYAYNWTGLPTNAGDSYNQSKFEHRDAGPSKYYNNTYGSPAAPYSHKLSVNAPEDIWRNNIFAQRINNNWGNAGAPDEQYNTFDNEITGTTISSPGIGTLKNQDFLTNFYEATGAGSLYFNPHASSTSRNQGVVIAGITDDDDNTPDKGARKFGSTWVPGYTPVTDSVPEVPEVPEIPETPGEEVALTDTVIHLDKQYRSVNIMFDTRDTLDNRGSGVDYNGLGWTHANTSGLGWYQNTLSWNNVEGRSFSKTFIGTRIIWFAERKDTHGWAGVNLDGKITIVNLGASNAGVDNLTGNPSFDSGRLAYGSHTITITVTENGRYVVHDFFITE